MTEHPHTIEGDIECSCHPLVLTVAADGSISRVAGGPLEEPIDTEVAPRAEGLLEAATALADATATEHADCTSEHCRWCPLVDAVRAAERHLRQRGGWA